jgi:hypothetical protein
MIPSSLRFGIDSEPVNFEKYHQKYHLIHNDKCESRVPSVRDIQWLRYVELEV